MDTAFYYRLDVRSGDSDIHVYQGLDFFTAFLGSVSTITKGWLIIIFIALVQGTVSAAVKKNSD